MAPVERPRASRDVCPIVGVGASAGGLEALELFLKNVPDQSGLAFVVVQHQDPKHKGMLVELLGRATTIPVVQVKDRLRIEPDHVYVIPAGKDMSLLHGVLHLLPQVAPRGLNLPIDFFFRSLAEDQQERSVGVILSGMGSDGMLGLRAIKEKAGAGFVQSLSSAKFDGMPRSAIEAGLADVIAPAEQLPEWIISYQHHALHITRPHVLQEEKAQSALDKVFVLLRSQTGNDFSLYKRSTVYRRIERRMSLHQIDKLAHYVRYLRENPKETELLFKELLIGVTSFFRDPAVWEHLKGEVIPALVNTRPQVSTLRAWVPGCSTGEEAFSLAIVLREVMEHLRPGRQIPIQIFATDLDADAIERARVGVYPANIAADVSPERLRRFFGEHEGGYRVSKEIREMVIFAPQNIIMDPPFTRLDVLSCRNLLIYLSAELQKKLIPLFHYSLSPGGVLCLGSAETIGAYSELFAPIDAKTRLYHRIEPAAGLVPPIEFPSTFASTPQPNAPPVDPPGASKAPPPNVQALADRLLVQRFSPAAVLVNEKGDILYISGRTGRYLEPAAGKANWNIFVMAREGLRYELSGAFNTASREPRAVTVRGVTGTNGGTQAVDITVQKLTEPAALRGTLMVVFADVPSADVTGAPDTGRAVVRSARVQALEKELHQAREVAQTMQEEMQSSQEELKSTNEELQSTNEELQSTNEELTTSKEEMQSLNEELQTVNHELQAKVDDLSRSNNDMKNLLNSTEIATLFLDSELRVRRFTVQTARIIKLIPTDAGRPITDIAMELDYPELAADAREVLRTLVFKEKLVAAPARRWFTVRIMPYRTVENVIDGVVITFTDATTAKTLENALREQASQLQQMAESLPLLVWGGRPDGACDYLSPQWIEYTGVPEADQLGLGWLDQVHPAERESVRAAWRAAVKAGTRFDMDLRIRGKGGAYHWFKARAVPIRDAQGGVLRWYGANSDVEDLKDAAESKKQAARRLASILDGIDEPFFALDAAGRITDFNSAAEQAFKRRRGDVLGRTLTEAFPAGRGTPFDERCRLALKGRTASSFETTLEFARDLGRTRIRLFPNEEGISVFVTRNGKGGMQRLAVEETEQTHEKGTIDPDRRR